jgi:toxin CcdB
MARFDVFANPFVPERGRTPYLLDVQNDHLGGLATHVVIPLRSPESFGTPASGLNPVLVVDGRRVVLDTASLAPVPNSLLNNPIARSGPWRDDVLDALDTLFGSY